MKLDFNQIKVLLVGDFMVDKYIFGSSERQSPEADIPIIVPSKEYIRPGGAGNVAMNLASLGADVTCQGIVGNDLFGKELISLLERNNVKTDYIEKVSNYQTTVKERIYLDSKQLVRIDRENKIEWNPKKRNYTKFDIIILSDYNKGVLQSNWFKKLLNYNLIIDPKKQDFEHYREAHIITPNLKELELAVGMSLNNSKEIINACKKLISNYNINYVVAKRGQKGMIVVGKNGYVNKISAFKVNSIDVTGAGDTVLSVLSLAYFKTRDICVSARLANKAASIAVSNEGTYCIKKDEIKI